MTDKLIAIFEGELERLFTINEVKKILVTYLNVEENELPQGNISKASFMRQVITYCSNNYLLPAFAEITIRQKESMMDPRLKQFNHDVYKMEIEEGTTIGKFKIIKELGRGGTGITYLASSELLNDNVALKTFYNEYSLNIEKLNTYFGLLRLFDEKGIKRIPKIVDLGWNNTGQAYIATKYVKGKKLKDIIKENPISFDKIKDIILKLLDLIEEFSSIGYFHGNIKPENIIIDDSNDIVVLEPCLSILTSQVDITNEQFGVLPIIGTPKNIAPEIIRSGIVDFRSEFYSLGVLIFEALTGKPPFLARLPLEIMHKHLNEIPPVLSSFSSCISKDLDMLIMDLLSKEPHKRPGKIEEIKERINAVFRKEEKEKELKCDKDKVNELIKKLQSNPNDESIIVDIEEAADGEEVWKNVAEALMDAFNKTVKKETKKNYLFRNARIYEIELKDYEKAEMAYKKILEIDPDEMLAEIAIEELRKGQGKFDDIIAMINERITKASTPQEKIVHYKEIAKIYNEYIQDAEKGMYVLLEALKILPEAEDILSELEAIAITSNRWNELITTCSEICQNPQSNLTHEKVSDLLVRMGYWYDKYINRPDFALPCYQQALTIMPKNDNALKGIENLYRRSQQWQQLAQILLSRADILPLLSEKRERKIEAADIFNEKLNDLEKAIDLYTGVLKEDPTHPVALGALEKIYVKKQEWDKLIDLYKAKAQSGETKEVKIDAYNSLAEIYEDHKQDMDKAIEYYEKVISLNPFNIIALKGLERLYAKLNKYQALIDNLYKQKELAETTKQKITILERIGSIYEEEFVDIIKAIATYNKILDIDPENEDTLITLERLYRRNKDWVELHKIYDKHATVIHAPEKKGDLYKRKAIILYEEIKDIPNAITSLEKASQFLPTNIDIMHMIARYKQEAGDNLGAVITLKEIIKNTEDAKKRAELWNNLGKLYEDLIKDDKSAIEAYRNALEAVNNDTSLQALVEIYQRKGDYNSTMDVLIRRIDFVEGNLAKSKLYIRMGNICREKLKEPQRAAKFYEKALELEKGSVEAAEPLSEIRREAGQWEEAAKIYETFSGVTKSLPKDNAVQLYEMWAEASVRLKDFQSAIKALKAGLEIEHENKNLLNQLAKILFNQNEIDEAKKYLNQYKDKYSDKDSAKENTELHYMLGVIEIKKENLKDARKYLEKSVEFESNNLESLKELLNIYKKLEQWKEAVNSIKNIVKILRDKQGTEEERFNLLIDLADMINNKLGNKDEAVEHYNSALLINPHSRVALLKLMQIYKEQKDWSNLVEIVLSLAEMENDPKTLGKYYQSAAFINDMELHRPNEALSYYQMALDSDPTLLQSFDAVVKILTEKQSWTELETIYKKTLEKLPEDTDKQVKLNLYLAMGELLEYRLEKIDEAIEIYEKSLQFDNENRERLEVLARLYKDNLNYSDKAIEIHKKLLEINPFRTDSYQWLRKIYHGKEMLDEEWCCCQTLVTLHNASEEEEKLYNNYKLNDIPVPQDRLTKELSFKYILHPQQDRNITNIFETILPIIAKVHAQPHAVFGIDRANIKDAKKDEHPFAQLIRFISGTLNIEPPELYYQEEDEGSAFLIRTYPACLIVGKSALLAATAEDEEVRRGIAFVLARMFAFVLSGNYVRMLLETGTSMRSWLIAAIKICIPNFKVAEDISAQVAEAISIMKKELTQDKRDLLVEHVKTFIETKGDVNLKKWAAAVNYSADRTGLLICDDLKIATEAIRIEEGNSTGVKDRLKEIHLFSVSDDYFAIRKRLLIDIK